MFGRGLVSRLVVVITVVAGPFVSGSAPVLAGGFDVNDVSFLFPKTGNLAAPFYPAISLSDLGPGGSRLIEKKLFGEIVRTVMDSTTSSLGGPFATPNFQESDIENFAVVNFRYDPCFPAAKESPADCVQQVRLIVQPHNGGKKGRPNEAFLVPDYSLHLLYQIGRGLPQAQDGILQDLLALKKIVEDHEAAQGGMPLAVSPALRKELSGRKDGRKTGPVAEFLKAMIFKYCRAKNLEEVTAINGSSDENGSLGNWFFLGGTVEGGHWTLRSIPRLPPNQLVQRSDAEDGFLDDPTDPHGAFINSKIGPVAARHLTPETIAAEIRDLEHLQDPRVTNPRNTDCVSCHLASPAEKMLLGKLPVWPAQVLPGEVFLSAPGITGLADPSAQAASFENVHVLGYFHDDPVVSPLVAQSAAEVAAQLNRILGLTMQPVSPPKCSPLELKFCFMTEPEASVETCGKKCR